MFPAFCYFYEKDVLYYIIIFDLPPHLLMAYCGSVMNGKWYPGQISYDVLGFSPQRSLSWPVVTIHPSKLKLRLSSRCRSLPQWGVSSNDGGLWKLLCQFWIGHFKMCKMWQFLACAWFCVKCVMLVLLDLTYIVSQDWFNLCKVCSLCM